ncbi:hypothetical protein OQ968_14705 [Mycobacterium sp. 663a-19]|uniref:hypothetical protein n=1 Tax=Mycobacterium sp. 663a-19 TaxID=2986148 RepID=UPI002D1EF3AA|nr:hypothetical protein [Mycobacterium sp. 663a-19]MEB3982511.1 hypothetical protein [Mycobacterium sp. 663a-19]
MSAEKGWIAEPQPPHIPKYRSRASSRADKIARSGALVTEADLRARQRALDQTWAEQEIENARLRKIDHGHIPPLRITDRYATGRRHKVAR